MGTWSPDVASEAEQGAFRKALFSEAAVGDYGSLIGKRSSTLALARLHLKKTGKPLSAEGVRQGMCSRVQRMGALMKFPMRSRLLIGSVHFRCGNLSALH